MANRAFKQIRSSGQLLIALAAGLTLGACPGAQHRPAPVDGAGPTSDAGADGSLGEVSLPDGLIVPDIRGPDIPVPSGPEWDPLCTGMQEATDPNCFTQALLFECSADAPPGSSPARLRRISRNELTRASGHRLTSTLGQNPFDAPPALPYSSYDRGVTVDVTTLDLYLSVINHPGTGWTGRDAGIRIRHTYEDDPYKCMWATPDEPCKALWLSGFIEDGLLFRPATDDEYADLEALLDAALDAEASNGLERQQTLSQVVSAAWLMPAALFRQELGAGPPDAHGRHRLTDWELGKSLAYTLTERGPGATASFHSAAGPGGSSWTGPAGGYLGDIEAAIEDGSIQEPQVLAQLVAQTIGGVDPERNDLNVELKLNETRLYRGDYWLAPKIRDFFREWLGYASFPTDFKDTITATTKYTLQSFDPNSLPGYSDYTAGASYGNLRSGYYGAEPTMVEQLDDMIARIVVEDEDVFRELLTTRRFFLPSTSPGAPCTDDSECSSVCLSGRCYSSSWKSKRFVTLPYGVEDHVDQTDEARWVTLPPDERAGVLTHPAWLAAHGDFFEDGPSIVHRGKWIREKLFCQYIPPLTKVQGIEAMLEPGGPDTSARKRVEESIEARSECMFCHVRMNSLGFAFEAYNHAGFLRAWDHAAEDGANGFQGPVDGSTTLDAEPAMGPQGAMPDPALHGEYSSPIELVEAFSTSQVAKRCFIRQTFRYFAGRDEELADACTLDRMETAYDERGSFSDMLAALVTSDTFRYRTHNPDAVCE